MTVYLDGKIYTLDPARPRVEALACLGGRVVAVGDSDEMRALARSPRDVVALGGRAVVPGLIDAHIHALGLGISLGQVDLGAAASLSDCLLLLRRSVSGLAPGAPLVGRGWNQNGWPECRWPSRQDLDAVVPDRVVVLSSHDGHLLWVNTRALDDARVTRHTPDPPGGQIDRDAHGEPTGVLRENATRLVRDVVPVPTDAEIDVALRRAAGHALAHGLTGIHNFEGREAMRGWGRLRESEALPLRVVQHIAHETLEAALDVGLFSGLGDEWLRVGALKLFADGTLGSQTAAMLDPYEGSTADHGIAMLAFEEMRDLAARAARGGLSTAIHAIGDAATRAALAALLEAPRVHAMPHRIEHAQLVHRDDIQTFARGNIIASMQPVHAVGDRDTADRWWGERCATAYAWRQLHDAGAVLAFGSDAPVESCDPLLGLYAAVAGHGRGDLRDVWRPEHTLSVAQALHAYTVNAASASGDGENRGRLQAGFFADMAVLSHDIFEDIDALEQARVISTIVGGQIASGDL